MPRPSGKSGSVDDEDEDRDLPLESDMDPDDGDDHDLALDPCPYCRKMIHEDAEWCHHCGKYLSKEDAPERIPLWIILTSAALLTAFVFWMMGRA